MRHGPLCVLVFLFIIRNSGVNEHDQQKNESANGRRSPQCRHLVNQAWSQPVLKKEEISLGWFFHPHSSWDWRIRSYIHSPTSKTFLFSSERLWGQHWSWTTGSKAGRLNKGERIKWGLETAMAKGKAGTNRTKATKRRRCDVCGSYGHVYGDFFYWRRVRKLSMQGYMLFRLKTSSRTTMEERRRFSEFIEIIYFLGNHYH